MVSLVADHTDNRNRDRTRSLTNHSISGIIYVFSFECCFPVSHTGRRLFYLSRTRKFPVNQFITRRWSFLSLTMVQKKGIFLFFHRSFLCATVFICSPPPEGYTAGRYTPQGKRPGPAPEPWRKTHSSGRPPSAGLPAGQQYRNNDTPLPPSYPG